MKTKTILMILTSILILCTVVSAQEFTTPGVLEVITSEEDESELVLPLMHTKVKTEIAGYIARVEVQQKFHNPYKEKIEARYVFPLPENSAVNEMFMKIGKKIIYSEVKEREEARRTYEKARDEGHKAALLEQERPNIYTQTVGNIMPGEEIIITIRYIQDLKYKNGEYTYFFPTVVGPRYIPGNIIGKQEDGFSPDTDRVSDASKITPQVIPPGYRSGHDIDISVNINTGTKIKKIKSISHAITTKKNKTGAKVTLKPFDTIPNKDFILTYKITDVDPTASILTHKKGKQGYFTLMINPPENVKPEKVTPKEIIFVVDCSGSMSGEPMAKAKAAMRHAIKNLNKNDTFQIIKFSDAANGFANKPVPNTSKNIKKALQFINEMRGTGGTQMIEGIKASLDYPKTKGKLRIVVFMTDGYIGNESEIISAIKKKLNKARLFSFGVGSSVNRFLLEGMAEAGRGRCEYIPLQEDTQKVVSEFYNRIRNPFWTDIKINWGKIKVTDCYPSQIPDLFDKTPILLIGKYKTHGTQNITMVGNINGKEYKKSIKAVFPSKNKKNHVLGTLWARKKIHELENNMDYSYSYRSNPDLKQEIINLAVQYKLMSRFTSMVAVEREIKTDTKITSRKVSIPVELPEGVNFDGVFGKARLTLTRIKPGDPILMVEAPENATSVVASFPFGLIENLEKDIRTDLWSCRFLVPRNVKDGTYHIKVMIICSDGERYELAVPYTIDSKAPGVDVHTEVVTNATGRALKVFAVPKVLNECENSIGIYTAILADIRDIKILDWKKQIHSLELIENEDELFWYGEIPLDQKNTSIKKITVQTLDYAGNFSTKEITVNAQ